ncbi:MAG: hypothetical protein ACI3U2_09775 [Anaerovibrio sp.]
MKTTKVYYGGALAGRKFPAKLGRKALIAAIALHLSLLNSNIALAEDLLVESTDSIYGIDNTEHQTVT